MTESTEVKIRIPLIGMGRSPNLLYEQIWANHRGNDLYQVWNLPAYAYNIELADIVRCRNSPDNELDAIEVVEKSGSIGVWLYFSSESTGNEISHSISELTNAEEKRPTFEKFSTDFWGLSLRDEQHFKTVLPVLNALNKKLNMEYEIVSQIDKPFWCAGQ